MISGLLVLPQEKGQTIRLENNFEEVEKLLKGKAFRLATKQDNIAIYYNPDFQPISSCKYMNQFYTFSGKIDSILCGPILILKEIEPYKNFCDLSLDEIKDFTEQYGRPKTFSYDRSKRILTGKDMISQVKTMISCWLENED